MDRHSRQYKYYQHLCIISQLCERGITNKRTIQQLMYLMERNGLELDLSYLIHYNGPYSSTLNTMTEIWEREGIIQRDYDKNTLVMIERTYRLISLEACKVEIVYKVISRFGKMTSIELESITTIDYIMAHRHMIDVNSVIKEIQLIKGTKFCADDIITYYKILNYVA